MTIRWNLSKKRGNLRPVLRLDMTLTTQERELCVPSVVLASSVPKPPDAGWRHCLPGQNERRPGWTPGEFHSLHTPNHREGSSTQACLLPWRKDNHYPEIEQSLHSLRQSFEKAVEAACQSLPMDLSGQLETTSETKRRLAPSLAADRILGLVDKNSNAA